MPQGAGTLRLCKGKIDQSEFSDTQCILPARHLTVQTCLDTLGQAVPPSSGSLLHSVQFWVVPSSSLNEIKLTSL